MPKARGKNWLGESHCCPRRRFGFFEMLLVQLDFVMEQIRQMEQRLAELVRATPAMQWLKTMPGIGVILAAAIELEIGEIGRFPSAPHFASYAGTTPRVHASVGWVRYGPLRSAVSQYLKWAFVEAANSVADNHPRYAERHVSQLYMRLRKRKGHNKAIGAVARPSGGVLRHGASGAKFQ